MAQQTRPSLMALTMPLYGSFAGKLPAVAETAVITEIMRRAAEADDVMRRSEGGTDSLRRAVTSSDVLRRN